MVGQRLPCHQSDPALSAQLPQDLIDLTPQPVGITLVGGTGDQLWEKSRFQKASHWPFSLR